MCLMHMSENTRSLSVQSDPVAVGPGVREPHRAQEPGKRGGDTWNGVPEVTPSLETPMTRNLWTAWESIKRITKAASAVRDTIVSAKSTGCWF